MCHDLVGLLPEIVAHGNNMLPITITLVFSQPFQTCDGFFLIFLILMQFFFFKKKEEDNIILIELVKMREV